LSLVVRAPFEGADAAVMGVVLELADAEHGEGDSQESSQDSRLEDGVISDAPNTRLALGQLLGYCSHYGHSLAAKRPTQCANGL